MLGDEEIIVMVNLCNRNLTGSIDLPAAQHLRLKKIFGDGAVTSDLERNVAGRVGFKLSGFGAVVKSPPPITR